MFPFVIVAPLPTSRSGLSLRTETEASADTGRDATSYIQCELIRSINTSRLVDRLGGIGPNVASRVSAVIKTLLN